MSKDKIRKFKCECGDSFTRKFNLQRHQEIACKLLKKDSANGNNNTVNSNNIVNSNIVNGSNTNCLNKTINSNNTLNMSTININFIPLNKEGINDLSATEWGEILTSNKNIFAEILERVNCMNNSHHNIYYKDTKITYGFVYVDNKLKKDKITNILSLFITNRTNDVRKMIDIWHNILDAKYISYISTCIDKIETNSIERNKLMRNLKPILNNYSKNICVSFKIIKSKIGYVDELKDEHNNFVKKITPVRTNKIKSEKIIDDDSNDELNDELNNELNNKRNNFIKKKIISSRTNKIIDDDSNDELNNELDDELNNESDDELNNESDDEPNNEPNNKLDDELKDKLKDKLKHKTIHNTPIKNSKNH
jgi:hypothetical protein